MTIADVAVRALDELAVSQLRDRVDGTVVLPDELEYGRIVPWNVAVPVQPAAVVFASSARDVSETVRMAAHRFTVAVQATGHGALPEGADTILVHTAGLAGCVVDPVSRTARIGAGTTWQQVMDAASPYGLAPLSGSAPGVGVIGFLAG